MEHMFQFFSPVSAEEERERGTPCYQTTLVPGNGGSHLIIP